MAEGARERLRNTPERPAGAGRESVGAASPLAPLVLAPNQLERFYRGGARIEQLRGGVRIEQLRGGGGVNGSGPEDWVGSTTTALGADSEGLSRLPDGRYLRDAARADPVGFLGAEHVDRWGANPALLVKLLDAGERLPVHFHPGRAFARDALGLRFGKTEAWIIVSADPGAVVHLGFQSAVDPATVARWQAEQDVAAMLAAMNELPVAAGDAVFVPAGTAHAIGAGILLVELQEPTDLSVLLEWKRFGVTDGSEHLRLGWERALAALDTSAAVPEDLFVQGLRGNAREAVVDLLPASAEPYFRAQRIATDGEPVRLEPSFAILVVLEGRPTLCSDSSDPLELSTGQTVLIPYGAGRTALEGHASMIRCRPPDPKAGPGQW